MSEYKADCGHVVDFHSLIFITDEGFKAFRIFQKYYGKKPLPFIIKKGGGFKKEYLKVRKLDKMICSDCFSEWQNVEVEEDD